MRNQNRKAEQPRIQPAGKRDKQTYVSEITTRFSPRGAVKLIKLPKQRCATLPAGRFRTRTTAIRQFISMLLLLCAILTGGFMKQAATEIKCVARFDRFRTNSWAKRGMPVPKIRGFKTVRDFRLRWKEKPPVYARVRELRSITSATIAQWQYARRKGWVKPWRVTLIGDNKQGITAPEAWSFFKHFRFPKLLLFELAFDFPRSSGVDANFVLQHALFGKSRLRADRGGEGQLRFGSRFSGKLVRCYEKESVDAFRVEIELHSSLLPRPEGDKRREIIDSRWPEIADAGFSILPAHLKFVTIRFKALRRHLRRRFGEHGDVLLEKTREISSQSLHSALGYLRRKGIHNVHRFLAPLPEINDALERAVDDWSTDFLRPLFELEEIDRKTNGRERRERAHQEKR
jgi:hypothetical protein